MSNNVIKLRTLKGEARLGLSQWVINPTTSVLTRGKDVKEMGEPHREWVTMPTVQNARVATRSWERQAWAVLGSPQRSRACWTSGCQPPEL